MLANIETIGPAEAQALLAMNTKNRHISQRIVRSFARDMADNAWIMNGESIKVSESNRLIDGQHRLLAVIESGSTITTLVIRGLDDAAQATVDTGIRRMFADQLQIDGEANAHNLAAAVRTAWYLDNFGRTRTAHAIPTQSELYEWLQENHQIREWLVIGRLAAASAIRYVPSLATTLGYLMGRKNLTQSQEFWESLASGSERPGSPIFALRENLIRDLGASRRMSLADRTAVTIKMWNAYRDDKEVKVAFFRGAGPAAETFPVIK